ncbi:MAG TPA: FG-GAP-like repeat-containing protein [Planctomycetota bacterium]|nr:FG-GAP-like repeat-containing protein [Planctomycetota bacterium]
MKSLPLATLALLSVSLPAPAQTPALQVNWVRSPVNGKWYGIDFSIRSWSEAEALAVSFGGHLATISSAQQKEWLWGVHLPGYSFDRAWIGLSDAANEGDFAWSSGLPLAYTNWNVGEPDDLGGQDHVQAGITGLWSDEVGSSKLRPLFEADSEPLAGWSWPKDYETTATPGRGCLVDIDADGDLDYIFPSSTVLNPGVYVYSNDGAGNLVETQFVPVPAGPNRIASADIDGDNDLDLVVACETGQVLATLSNAGGILTIGSPVASGLPFREILLENLDGDEHPDLIATTGGSVDTVLLYKGAAGGAFEPASVIVSPAGFGFDEPTSPVLTDVDSDGDLDLVVGFLDGFIRVYASDGAGGFIKLHDIFILYSTTQLIAMDIDGDRDDDLLFAGSAQCVIFENPGTGAFNEVAWIPANPLAIAAADFDRDGWCDAAMPVDNTDEVRVLLNHGQWIGGTGSPPWFEYFSSQDNMTSILTGDLDGDSLPDLVVPKHGGPLAPRFTVWINQRPSDCNGNGIDDEHELSHGLGSDCNQNGLLDECDIASGMSLDLDGNGVPDDCLAPPLGGAPATIGVSTGGTQGLALTAGQEHAALLYFVLGSASGTAPGVLVGGHLLPLQVFDQYFLFTVSSPNTAVLTSTLGILSPEGTGQAFINVPAGLSTLAGATLHHAYVVFGVDTSVVYASNALPLLLVP